MKTTPEYALVAPKKTVRNITKHASRSNYFTRNRGKETKRTGYRKTHNRDMRPSMGMLKIRLGNPVDPEVDRITLGNQIALWVRKNRKINYKETVTV